MRQRERAHVNTICKTLHIDVNCQIDLHIYYSDIFTDKMTRSLIYTETDGNKTDFTRACISSQKQLHYTVLSIYYNNNGNFSIMI